jgi:hypothetical protein
VNWFKMFTEARNDAKLRSLTDAQHRTWFRLLCYAAEQENGGKIGPKPINLVALETAEGSVGLLEETCNALQTLHCVSWKKCNAEMIEICFQNFAERQARKPSDAPERIKERVAKFRSKSKPRKGKGEPSKNGDEPCKASNALLALPVTPVTPIEESREEKRREHTPPTPSQGILGVGESDDEPFNPGGPDSGSAAPVPEGWTPAHKAVLDRQTERFGASNGDRTIADLLRDFEPRIVAAACDHHYVDNGGSLDPRRLLGICRAMQAGRWKLPAEGSPQTIAMPGRRLDGPTNMPPVVPESFRQTPEQKARMDAEMRKNIDECRRKRM